MAPSKRNPFLTDKRKLFIFLSLATLGGVGYVVSEKNGRTAETTPATAPSAKPAVSPKASPTGGFGASMGAPPEPKNAGAVSPAASAPAASPETVTPPRKPKPELLADGKVRTVLAPGETLVTGGYLNTEGKWEFSMVTATVIEAADGQKQVRLSSSLIAMDNAGVGRAGLGTLLTGEVQTRQHGEVWSPGEARRILKDMEGRKGSELLSAPTMVMMAGAEGTVSVSSEDGVLIQIGAKADVLPDGNLDLTVSNKRQAPGK